MKRALITALSILFSYPVAAKVGTCPISADFITEPEILENVVPLAGAEINSTTKRAFVTGGMVSIECTEMNPEIVFPGASDAEMLQNYARFWSVQPVDNGNNGISQGSDPTPHFILSGTKTIQGIDVTYSYRLFRFPSSFAMVATGEPTDTPDRSDVERFLKSLRTGGLAERVHPKELSEIVRDGNLADLRQALAQRQWSILDLSKALVSAAGLNRPAEARLLLEAGADPNFRILSSSVIVTAVRENSVAALNVLLQSGGDPNMRVMFDWAPLHHAVLANGSRYQALESLLKHGAEIDARTSLKISPLHRAAGFCDARAVQLLLSAGANSLLTEKYGRTAYQRSVEAGCLGIGGLSPP